MKLTDIFAQVSRKDAESAEAQNFKRIQAHKTGPYDFENIQFGQVRFSFELIHFKQYNILQEL